MTHDNHARAIMRPTSSNRAFGCVFALAFVAVAISPALYGKHLRLWSLAISGYFFLAAIVAPDSLGLFNRWWTKLGFMLHRVTTPIVLALMFFLVMTPAAILMRRFSKNLLPTKPDPTLVSYWIHREPPAPLPDSYKNLF